MNYALPHTGAQCTMDIALPLTDARCTMHDAQINTRPCTHPTLSCNIIPVFPGGGGFLIPYLNRMLRRLVMAKPKAKTEALAKVEARVRVRTRA